MIAAVEPSVIVTWAISFTFLVLAIIGAGVVVRRATVTFLVTTLEKTVDALKEAAEANEKQQEALRDEITTLERTKAALQAALDAEKKRSERIQELITDCELNLKESRQELERVKKELGHYRAPRTPRKTP